MGKKEISRKLTVKDFVKENQELNRYPNTEGTVWNIRQKMCKKGLEKAFVKMGRRVLIDENEFWKALDKYCKE